MLYHYSDPESSIPQVNRVKKDFIGSADPGYRIILQQSSDRPDNTYAKEFSTSSGPAFTDVSFYNKQI
ncbi:MAG: hypothetical protein K2J15_03430 [Muribaculaceae bacterium]|nr:hypothetical protein [Muribaculaceae bacterium]